MTHLWSCALDKGDSVRVLFINYTKAFDHVDHTILLNKLISLDVPHCLVKWMFSFLNGCRQRVKINNTFSNWITLKGGMPQGTLLGPLTFIILLDDLNPPCAVHKFVDDTTITEILSAQQTPSVIDVNVHYLVNWSRSNKMLINYTKTKEMILGNAKSNPPPTLLTEGKKVNKSPVSNY